MFEDRVESFPQREERVLSFWKRERIFQKSVQQRKNSPLFTIYDGPPFATGLPHYGHLLAGTIKDVIPRYKTMKGYYVPRRFGWDCHGLPVESEIESAYNLSGTFDIERFGIASFNEACRDIVSRYTKEWRITVDRMGRWIDFDHAYRTMDMPFMESVWWVFGELWNRGLVYEGVKVMPFSARLGTPLSNFEANLNYREVDDPSITLLFPLVDDPQTSLLVWTTTPWTLPSNLSLMVGEEIEYVKVRDSKGGHYILGKGRLSSYFREGEVELLETFKGSALKGRRYRPLFDYFVEHKNPNAFTIITDISVSDKEGTGVVHGAPAFGESDFFACAGAKIGWVCPVDQNGRFTDEVPDLEGIYVKDADKKLIKQIKDKGRLFRHGRLRHRYPCCWRSDTPLIYRVVRTWFVSVEKIKEKLLEVNRHIHWVPFHVKGGRFGKWLENARDWAISRNRYWGTPIPIWRSSSGDVIVIHSMKELEKRSGKRVKDLHRHHIDDVTFEEGGEVYTRIPEVFDCWFESGSMPYAQHHFPFENKKETLKAFPADFVAEGMDQTRGWFYTLNILSTALFEKPAFKNVVVNGIVLAKDGAKMSKRLKNYPDPELIMNKYGADAMRLYLLHSPAVQGDDLRFSERGVEGVLRQFLIPLWNSYHFLSLYANIYGWKPGEGKEKRAATDIDRWILSCLQKLITDVEQGMDGYVLSEAVEPFLLFIEQLTNWYIRRNRTRFWSEKDLDDRSRAFATLYTVLLALSKIAAPLAPFISDAIYQALRKSSDPVSVHLCDFPSYEDRLRDMALEREMLCVQNIVSMGHALRKEHKLKVRQPLSKIHLISPDAEVMGHLKKQETLILEELNVKEVEYHAKEGEFVEVSIRPNFRTLGKRAGSLMKQLQVAISSLDIDALADGATLLDVEGRIFSITSEDVLIERKVREGLVAANKGGMTIVLDTTLSESLLMEGLAREIVNKINMQRRNQGFEVTDRIILRIDTNPYVRRCFKEHEIYITGEVLAKEIYFEKTEGVEWDLNGEHAVISLQRCSNSEKL